MHSNQGSKASKLNQTSEVKIPIETRPTTKPKVSKTETKRIRYTIVELKKLANSPLSKVKPKGEVLDIVIDNPKNQAMKFKKLQPYEDEQPTPQKKVTEEEKLQEEDPLWDDIKQKDWNFESTSSLNEREKKRKEEFEKLRKEFQKKPSSKVSESKPEASFFFGFENSLLETLEEDEQEDLSAFEETKPNFDSKSIFSMMNDEFVDFKEMVDSQMPSEQDILKNLTQQEEMTDVQSIEAELLKSLKKDQPYNGQNNVEFEQNMMQNNLPMFLMHQMPPPNFYPPPTQEMFQQGFPMNEMGPYGPLPPFGNDFMQPGMQFGGFPPPPPEFLMMMMDNGMNSNIQGNVPMNAMTVEEIERLMMKK